MTPRTRGDIAREQALLAQPSIPPRDSAHSRSSTASSSSKPPVMSKSKPPPRSGQKIGGAAVPVFLEKLYEILDEDKYKVFISWGPEGKDVHVHQPVKLASILPAYYNHSNYSSFARQMNIYSFNRPPNKPHTGHSDVTPHTWSHPFLLRTSSSSERAQVVRNAPERRRPASRSRRTRSYGGERSESPSDSSEASEIELREEEEGGGEDIDSDASSVLSSPPPTPSPEERARYLTLPPRSPPPVHRPPSRPPCTPVPLLPEPTFGLHASPSSSIRPFTKTAPPTPEKGALLAPTPRYPPPSPRGWSLPADVGEDCADGLRSPNPLKQQPHPLESRPSSPMALNNFTHSRSFSEPPFIPHDLHKLDAGLPNLGDSESYFIPTYTFPPRRPSIYAALLPSSSPGPSPEQAYPPPPRPSLYAALMREPQPEFCYPVPEDGGAYELVSHPLPGHAGQMEEVGVPRSTSWLGTTDTQAEGMEMDYPEPHCPYPPLHFPHIPHHFTASPLPPAPHLRRTRTELWLDSFS